MLTPRELKNCVWPWRPDQVGFILDKLEMLAFRTTFDPVRRSGLVPVNTSIINIAQFDQVLAAIKPVFKSGLAVSQLSSCPGRRENRFGHNPRRQNRSGHSLQRGGQRHLAQSRHSHRIPLRRHTGNQKQSGPPFRGPDRLCRHIA